MNRASLNIVCAVSLSMALLYAGSAWTILKCTHGSDCFADSETSESVASDADEVPELECSHPDYQLGPLAMGWLSQRITDSMDGVCFDNASEAALTEQLHIGWLHGLLERFALFDKVSLHLFLSIFRI